MDLLASLSFSRYSRCVRRCGEEEHGCPVLKASWGVGTRCRGWDLPVILSSSSSSFVAQLLPASHPQGAQPAGGTATL